MTNIRRYFRTNDISFLTHVTCGRAKILVDNFDIFWESVAWQQQQFNLDVWAWVVLPDHFHILLSAGDADISMIIKKMKLSFSSKYRKIINKQSGRVWQYRFWDHIIRNQDDLNTHIDYIHYNPVKHGLVTKPGQWSYSSFGDYVKQNLYPPGWGEREIGFKGEFGE
jgi:putative transposase